MTSARVFDTVRSWMNKMTLTQELTASAGAVAFLMGLLTSDPLWRTVALVLAGSSIAYVIVTLRSKSLPDLGSEAPSIIKEEMESEIEETRRPGEPEREKAPDSPAIPSFSESHRAPRAEYEFKLSDFIDVQEDILLKDAGPKSEFSYLMKKVLTVVKEVAFGHTVALYWINREKHQLVLDSFVTDSEWFTSHRRREIGSDLISQVAVTGHPRILNNVNSAGQLELLGYYQTTVPIQSFVAVPIFYPRATVKTDDAVAVLVLDCLSEDAFGPETMTMLGDYSKLISALIKSYTGKYDLLLDSEVLRSITRIREQMKFEFSTHTIVRALAEETSRLVAWDYVSLVVLDESRKSWIIQFVMNRVNDSYVAVGQEIDPSNSIVASVLQSGLPRVVDNASSAALPRFYKPERIDSPGSMMIVPINSLSRCYGALVVESKDRQAYSDADVKVIQKLADSASWGLEVLNLTDVVNNYVLVDETTGVAARKYFMERVHEEVQRANDFDTDITLVMISIDGVNEHVGRYGKEGFDFVLQNVGRMLRTAIRPYDLVGRFDFNRFAVLLVSTTANDAYLWAEKFRKNIASNVMNIDQKTFSVTVSVGVCGAVSDISDLELMEHAGHVLAKAVEAGGNMVRVY
jgi:diguanylate cyclase (GGDEF)-like protein